MKKLVDVRSAADPHWVGDGFFVRSAFTYDDGADVLSPFLLLDYGAPRVYAPTTKRRGVGPHPHRGFETVTISYEGEIEHRDSSGGGGKIGPGDVQWMTAGSGIVHEEFHSIDFAKRGGSMHMVQLWVNLPAAKKGVHARYQGLLASQIPTVALANGAGEVRVIAGSFGGKNGPAKTHTPIELWTVVLRAGQNAELELPEGYTMTFLLLSGRVDAGGREVGEGELAIYSREGASIAVNALRDATLLLMSGEPIDEPIVGYGPFVMNTPEEIEQAFADYQSGRMGSLTAS